MLPFSQRLIKKKDFDRVYRLGRGFGFGSLYVKFVANNLAESRLGVAVGLKFSKKAVVRNRLKRQIREILRQKKDLFKNGFDIVVMLGKRNNDQEAMNSDKLKKDLEAILEKTNLIK